MTKKEPSYSSVGGGESFSSYTLTRRDLEKIVAEHFGFDPGSVSIESLELPESQFLVFRPLFRRSGSGRGVGQEGFELIVREWEHRSVEQPLYVPLQRLHVG